MFKKNLTKVLACILSVSCLLSTTSALAISADDTIGSSDTNTQVFTLNEEDNGQPPVYYDYSESSIMPCDDTKPSYDGNLWNLSYNAYGGDGNVKASFKHEVYTNYCFTFNEDTVRMHVLLSGDSLFQYFKEYCPNHYIEIELHEYYKLPLLTGIKIYDNTVGTAKIVNTSSNAGKVFTALKKTNSTSKYYVKFSKPKDGFEVSNVNVSVSLI